MRVIEATALSKEYGSRRALDRLSLGVEEGDIFGFLRPNGAGKMTTISILSGLLAPTDGSATVAGIDVPRHPRAIKRIVGVLPEIQGYYGWMTGEEYLGVSIPSGPKRAEGCKRRMREIENFLRHFPTSRRHG